MLYVPFNFEQINLIQGTYAPSEVLVKNNSSFLYWERSLFQRALSTVIIDTPDIWEGAIDLFNWVLYGNGFVPIFERDEYGITFQPGTLDGIDWYYRPTHSVITNPKLKGGSLRLQIGQECEILKLTPDYMGIFDVVDYYAEQLAHLRNAINMSLINNKYAWMLGAKNKAAAEALKKMLDKINSGEPAIIFDQQLKDDPQSKDAPWQFWNRGNLKDSYLTTQQLADFVSILHAFDTEIGIPTLPIEKKERMIDREADSNDKDSAARAITWVNTINKSAVSVNEHYGLSIRARLRWDPKGGAEDAGTTDADGSL